MRLFDSPKTEKITNTMHTPKIKDWVGFFLWSNYVGYKRRILGNEYGINHHNIENRLRNTWELENTIRASSRAWWEHTLGWTWVWDTQCSRILSTALFFFANSTLAKCKVDIAQFSSWKLSGLHSQVDNFELLFAKSSSSLHLSNAWMFFFFQSAQTFSPEN
jgi:hypothetical protein